MPIRFRSILTGAVLVAGISVPVLLAVEATREPACSRGCLLDFTNDYLEAMLAHQPSALRVASDLKATENGKPLRLGEGLWKSAKGIPYREAFADASTGQAGFFGVVAENNGESALFVLRLKVKRRQISEVETLVARAGAHTRFSPATLTAPNPVFEETLPDADRAPRDAMIAAVNGYFDAIEQHHAAGVFFHPECNEWTNGVQVTNTAGQLLSCAQSLRASGHIAKVRGRRFPIVDEDRGLVLAAAEFDVPAGPPAPGDGPRTVLRYGLFKLDTGRIRGIEEFMMNAPIGASSGWE